MYVKVWILLNFMSKIEKWNCIFILSMTWINGEDVGAFPWSLGFKPWWMCVNVCNVYIHWCIMYKYDIQNIYDGSEYIQKKLFK